VTPDHVLHVDQVAVTRSSRRYPPLSELLPTTPFLANIRVADDPDGGA
jgi:hypothetical protein